MKRRPVVTVAASAAMLILSVIGPDASMAEPLAAAGDNHVDPVVAYIAQDDGISVAAATEVARFEGSGALIGSTARELYGVRYAGLVFHHGTASLRVKGEIDRPLADKLLNALAAARIDTTRIELVGNARYTEEDQAALVKEIAQVVSKYTTQPFSVGPDLLNDSFAIDLDKRDVEQAEAAIGADFPDVPIAVVGRESEALPKTASCNSTVNSTVIGYWSCEAPLRGGVEMVWTPNSNQPDKLNTCTSGVMVRSKSDNSLYIMTAGHCVQESDTLNKPWYATFPAPGSTQHLIGYAHTYTWGAPNYSDAGLIAVQNPNWTARAWILVNYPPAGEQESYSVTGVSANSVGLRVCKSGRTTGTTCGTIDKLNVTNYYCSAEKEYQDGTKVCLVPKTRVDGLARSNMCVLGGDSGSPVFSLGTAYGIVSGSTTTGDGANCVYGYHVGIVGAANALNVNVAIDAP